MCVLLQFHRHHYIQTSCTKNPGSTLASLTPVCVNLDKSFDLSEPCLQNGDSQSPFLYPAYLTRLVRNTDDEVALKDGRWYLCKDKVECYFQDLMKSVGGA